MNNPKVSIIMPVYNTESYVSQAVESIIEQTLSEIEIIIINDGSTDNSLQILQKYAQEDSRIQLYSQENSGQSIARNKGVTYATGQYLYFMDSDDLLDIETLSYCYDQCEKSKLDFVYFNAEIINPDSGVSINLNYNHSDDETSKKIYKGEEALNKQLIKQKFTPSPCLNFIRRTYYSNAHLFFFPNIIHEDQLFTVLLYCKAERVMSINRYFFKRRFRKDSTMTQTFTWKNIHGYLCVTRELLTYIKKEAPQQKQIINSFLKQMLDAAVWQAYVLPLSKRIKLFFICILKYNKYVTKRTLMVLLFKTFLK